MKYREQFHNSDDWKDRILIMELFHLLMLHRDKAWNLGKTAKYFDVSVALVSENMRVARALKLGILDACTSRDGALKLLRKLK